MHSAFLTLTLGLLAADAGEVALPKVLDPRLKIELFAAEPDIVTPCGIAVDARGHVVACEPRPDGRMPDCRCS